MLDWTRNDASYKLFLLLAVVLAYVFPGCVVVRNLWQSEACLPNIVDAQYREAYRKQVRVRNTSRTCTCYVSRNLRTISLISQLCFSLLVFNLLMWTPFAILCCYTLLGDPCDVTTLTSALPSISAKMMVGFLPLVYWLWK